MTLRKTILDELKKKHGDIQVFTHCNDESPDYTILERYEMKFIPDEILSSEILNVKYITHNYYDMYGGLNYVVDCVKVYLDLD